MNIVSVVAPSHFRNFTSRFSNCNDGCCRISRLKQMRWIVGR